MGTRAQGRPLEAYAALGDGRTAALVARDGALEWMCLGRFDGPAAFLRLLDAQRGGAFRVGPAEACGSARRYVGWTNVLATDFSCARGRVRLTDALVLPEAGGGPAPLLVRRVEGLAGQVEMEALLEPGFDWARAPALVESGGWQAGASGGGWELRVAGPARFRRTAGRAGPALRARWQVRAGQVHHVVLSQGTPAAPPPLAPAQAEEALRGTLRAWEAWVARGHFPGPHAALLRRSALVLKLLTYSPTGAVVAAPTTSLPEAPGGTRNWDYRYCWLRDASWVVSALMGLGYHDESMAFLAWLERLGGLPTPPPVFLDVEGSPARDEQVLGHLAGWGGSAPVRVGNGAARQDQHDVFGEVVSAIHRCVEGMPRMRPLRPGLWALVERLADGALQHGLHADRGLWEVRDASRRFLSSRLLCWTALDRALALARGDARAAGRLGAWRRGRAVLRRLLLTEHLTQGVFSRAVGEPWLDASALLLPRQGLLPGTDARVQVTRRRIEQRLLEGGLVRRYEGPDGLEGREGAFLPCSFWLADCQAQAGLQEEAEATFARAAACANDVGLLSEEAQPDSGALLGNFPQGLSHLALVRAGLVLSAAREARAPSPRALPVPPAPPPVVGP